MQDVGQRLAEMEPGPVVGVTGTGGAGKSSLVDEILIRFLEAFPEKRAAVLSVDPSRRRTGGALLGDRIRMNAVSGSDQRIFMRSMATRRAHLATSAAVSNSLDVLRAAGFDLIVLETAGIGQSDSEVAELADLSVYVMTPEFGAPSQLEKIDMLDYADLVVINKFDKRGALDALREVRKAVQRNRKAFDLSPEEMPVFGTSAHRFGDPGTNAFFNALFERLGESIGAPDTWRFDRLQEDGPSNHTLIDASRAGYLSNIVNCIRKYRRETEQQADVARRADGLLRASAELGDDVPSRAEPYPEPQPKHELESAGTEETNGSARIELQRRYNELLRQIPQATRDFLRDFDRTREKYQQPEQTYRVRDRDISIHNTTQTLSDTRVAKVSLPETEDWAELVRYARLENMPGQFPYTAGVFPFKRSGEDPTRMFAGEGTAERTNRRFHYVSRGQEAVRLSTAFDSVTLYGADPHTRPDIYGKVGNSGVSVATLDDAKRLYSGFDLVASATSVSMTINGPAPTILAFFFNTAIDAACERHLREAGQWETTATAVEAWFTSHGLERPVYRDELPEGHDGTGLGFLGISADRFMDADVYGTIKARVLSQIRGTLQADILKEDQAQNTCIFSTEFALKMMGDVQEYFIDHDVRNFYSVSISGYHIAEAGANPVTQLALTLANGFTFVEYYLARGMEVSDFAPNISFFFSNGLDPEYSVIGRVARRIWAVAMRDLYGADGRSQKLKYHVQTSGRSLHAQEIDFNDIRTTLQALYAIMDNCNSLHTNAYDEAITTPTEDSVRRALAIQLIINRELGLSKNENPLQGSYFYEQLTDQVEAAVLDIFESLDARGGVLGAMETMYQRSRIQDESLQYEQLKNSGELPLVGINTFVHPDRSVEEVKTDLIRSTDEEKQSQIEEVAALKCRFENEQDAAIDKLKDVARTGGNLFAELMEAAKVCSLGQISQALYKVGGAYRRSM